MKCPAGWLWLHELCCVASQKEVAELRRDWVYFVSQPPSKCVSLMVEPNATVVMIQVQVLYALKIRATFSFFYYFDVARLILYTLRNMWMLNFIPLIFYLVLGQNSLCFEQLKYNKHRVPYLKITLNIIISLYAGNLQSFWN